MANKQDTHVRTRLADRDTSTIGSTRYTRTCLSLVREHYSKAGRFGNIHRHEARASMSMHACVRNMESARLFHLSVQYYSAVRVHILLGQLSLRGSGIHVKINAHAHFDVLLLPFISSYSF